MSNTAPKWFKIPSPTGRMSHNQPKIQMLPTPTDTPWQRELDKIHRLRKQSVLSGKAFTVSQQEKREVLRRGDLVVWSPAGAPGLWRITDVSAWYDPNDVDYKHIEESMAAANENPCEEITLSSGEKCKLKVRRVDVPRGKVRLEWEGGWEGYATDRKPVIVKIEEVCLANEMEALGIAAL